jgi:NTP pyrophosphatase (non-canonical NTP hydrolase)
MPTLALLQEATSTRCKSAFFPLSHWSPPEWGNALAGEVGETCNLLKKAKRDKINNKTKVAKELADVVIYSLLTAAALDIDLEVAVIKKFNEVSRRRNCAIKLPVPTNKDKAEHTALAFLLALKGTHVPKKVLSPTAKIVLKKALSKGNPFKLTPRALSHLQKSANKVAA